VPAEAAAAFDGPLSLERHADGSLTLIERYRAYPRLIILGGGHIALALADIAHLLEFETIVYDDRPSFANTDRFRSASKVICDSFANLTRQVAITGADFVVSATRGHLHDKECLEALLAGVEPAYTGMIGSQRRVAIVREQLREEGFDEGRIERIYAPIGLRIGAITPAEIAISIMAQIIEIKRGVHQSNHSFGTDSSAPAGAATAAMDLEAVEAIAAGTFTPEALITVVATEGSVPTEVGCKLAMTYDGRTVGTVGGGCSEAEAMQAGREVIKQGGWRLITIDLTDAAEDEGMVCGGALSVLVEQT
jgi:xanthine dehydrogenase accessory factor